MMPTTTASRSLFVCVLLTQQLSPLLACPYLAQNQQQSFSSKNTPLNNAHDGPPLEQLRYRQLQRNGNNNNDNNNLPQIDPTPVTGLSPAQAIAAAKADITASLLPAGGRGDSRAALFVRLAFHDCVGTCDGCVDTSMPDNFGLSVAMDALTDVVTKYSLTALTRADVWVLAGLTAAEATQDAISFDMEWVGRSVCDTVDGGPPRTLPSAHLHTAGLVSYFADTFNFTARETTAIMGAHTLGNALSQNSGFNGRAGWVRNEDQLDNAFYRTLLDNGALEPNLSLELQNNGGRTFPNQYLWRYDNNNLFMLNADLAVVKNLEGYMDPDTGEVTCALYGNNDDACPASELLPVAREYEASNILWLQDFRDAFLKMTSTGCNAQECTLVVEENDTTPTVAPTEATLEAPTTSLDTSSASTGDGTTTAAPSTAFAVTDSTMASTTAAPSVSASAVTESTASALESSSPLRVSSAWILIALIGTSIGMIQMAF